MNPDIHMQNEHETSLSIVVPVYNEENNVAWLHSEIVQVCSELGHPFEIIIVNDGSTDKTGQIVRTLSPLKYIRLRRNFGQTAKAEPKKRIGFTAKEEQGYYESSGLGDHQSCDQNTSDRK